MSSFGKKSKKTNGVYDFASHRSTYQDDVRDESRSLDEIVISLQREKSYVDKLSRPGEKYVVETYIKVNNREWYFSSGVKRNGQEIKNDNKLIREVRCRKPVPQADQTESRWIAFVKEAAKIHLEKYEEVNRRVQVIDDPPHSRKKFLIYIGLLVILAGICFGIYKCWPEQASKPPPKPPPHFDVPEQPTQLSPGEIERMVLEILMEDDS